MLTNTNTTFDSNEEWSISRLSASAQTPQTVDLFHYLVMIAGSVEVSFEQICEIEFCIGLFCLFHESVAVSNRRNGTCKSVIQLLVNYEKNGKIDDFCNSPLRKRSRFQVDRHGLFNKMD